MVAKLKWVQGIQVLLDGFLRLLNRSGGREQRWGELWSKKFNSCLLFLDRIIRTYNMLIYIVPLWGGPRHFSYYLVYGNVFLQSTLGTIC